MAEQKKKKVYFTTPKGVAKFPHLTVPQFKVGNNTVDPNYNVTLLLDPNDAATIELQEKIVAAHAAGLAAAKKADPKKRYTDMGTDNMFKEDTTKDDEGNQIPNGKMAFKFKVKASGQRKDGTAWTFKPALLDGRGAGLPKDAAIFGGSVIQVSYTFKHTPMPTGSFYTSLTLEAVMAHVIKSEWTRSASEYGFSVESDQDALGEQVPAAGDSGAEANPDF